MPQRTEPVKLGHYLLGCLVAWEPECELQVFTKKLCNQATPQLTAMHPPARSPNPFSRRDTSR